MHEIAQLHVPESRIVYVDYAAEVVTHARARLTSGPNGAVAYIHADVRDPVSILSQAAATLDFSQPIGLLLVAVLHFVPDQEARDYVQTLREALPGGSYLALSHATVDHMTKAEAAASLLAVGGPDTFRFRSREEVAAFFDGTTLLDPGLASVAEWRRKGRKPPPPAPTVGVWGGVGVKP